MQRSLLLFACFLVYSVAFAQRYPFVHYTPGDGLVNSRVHKVGQDSRGRMYFMTYGGLSVYDGTKFRNYTTQTGLSSDVVNDMLEIEDDSCLIACNTNQLNYIHHGKVGTVRTADGFSPLINKFLKSADGSVYVVADDGLFRFTENRFIRLPFTDKLGRDAGKYLSDIIEWKQFFIILSDAVLANLGPGNLYIYDRSKGKVIANEDKIGIPAACIINDHIYVSANNGLAVLDTSTWDEHKLTYQPVQGYDPEKISSIIYLYSDKQNDLWFYSIHGKIVKIDPSGSLKEFSVSNGLSSNNFLGIFRDREGSVWISNGPGVDKLVNDNVELYEGFEGQRVNNLYTDSLTDSVYLHFAATKMITTRYKDKMVESIPLNEGLFPNAFNIRKNKLYISDGKGLYLFPRHSHSPGAGKTLIANDTLAKGFGNTFIDPYENIVLLGQAYLTAVIADTFVFHFPVNDFMDQLVFDRNKRLWAVTRSGELYVLKINPNDPSHYFERLNGPDKNYPSFSVRCLTVDQFNNVWIGTRFEGLYCLHFDDHLKVKSFEKYTTKEGLSDNFIVHLTCDKDNTIWASTAGGVDNLRYAAGIIHINNITRSNYIYEYTLKTFVDKSGVAWSLTADGKVIRISHYNGPALIIPSLFITEVKTGNNVMDSVSLPSSFSYRQNAFSISVAAPSFYAEKQVKYSYLLQGSGNDQWSAPSNNSTFSFIGMNPGKYHLRIKAIFPGGRYPDQVADYSFVIHPPWWQRWWFRILLGAFVVAISWIGVRAYYRRKLERQKTELEKQQAVEKERTRIATDIHDDLGSGLSRIRYLGEMVKLKSMQQKNIVPEIEKISAFSDEMVDKMNEIVWALNEKNDSLEAMVSYTRSFAVEYLSGNNLQCHVQVPDEVPFILIKGDIRRNIFLSVKECLHNIVKHAEATEVVIIIRIDSQLMIDMRDNGKGIDWEKIRPFSNGIMNIKKRMKEAGGTSAFVNEQGTRVVLTIPLLQH